VANTFSSSGATITGGSINGTTIGATTASTGKFSTLEATGVTTVQAGTVSLPAITTTGDTNTGIFFPAADTIAFTEGGVESMRINSSGQMGIGTTSVYGTNSRLSVLGSVTANDTSIVISDAATTTIGLALATPSSGSVPYIFGNTALAFGSNGAERMRIDSSGNVGIGTSSPSSRFTVFSTVGGVAASFSDNTAYTLAIARSGASGNVGMLYGTAGSSLALGTDNAERMRIDSSGNVGIGITPDTKFEVSGSGAVMRVSTDHSTSGTLDLSADSTAAQIKVSWYNSAVPLVFKSGNTEQMRITSGGNLLVATTSSDVADANGTGASFSSAGNAQFSRASGGVMNVNRKTDDGTLVFFQQDASAEGSISVSGTTVSYNGGHLSRWSQLPNNQKDNTLLKGTVMSNLDDMCVWTKDGEVLPNEQLNKMKVSDIDGDTNVAGVFVSWEFDEQCQSDDMNVAMTGDMIIRIAESVVVQKGDLLMSAGDGTAKPQGDDIRKSKTIAKVTSNHVTCTYADGSYCVPCVLMAC
jgi:hypothetical protein